MVRIERISRNEPEPETDPEGERFKLIEVYVQEPTAHPNEEYKVAARPYEFEGELPSKYSSSCPHCGQGIWLERYEIQTAVDRFFIACPSCNKGTTASMTPIVDPFINPVTEKIAETSLDGDLSKAQELKPDTKTVLEKFGNNTIDQEPIEPSEIEQILSELESNSE